MAEIEATETATSEDAEPKLNKRVICRYGRGCTHLYDAVHREKFWHPTVPRLSADEIQNQYICNECGQAFDSLRKLRLHLVRKTAWSNASLCGCRVSILLENKEWHEGVVLRFDKGRHLVQIKTLDEKHAEKKWFNMSKVAFYVVELPGMLLANEVKEQEDQEITQEMDEEKWAFSDEVSLEYAYAQSILFKLYGNKIQETGHKTKGHVCLTDEDKEVGKQQKGSLLYGELLPRGVNKALDSVHLNGRKAKVLYDLGMGTGKVAIQAFLQFRNLRYVYGVELSHGRYLMAEAAAIRLAMMQPHTFELRSVPGKSVCLIERIGMGPQDTGGEDSKEADGGSTGLFDPNDMKNVRVLHMVHGDMLQTPHMHLVDVIMLETDVPSELQPELFRLLHQTTEGCRALTYLDLHSIWGTHNMPFRQLESNRNVTDRFPTSWSVQRGHHFYMWLNTRSLNPFRRPPQRSCSKRSNRCFGLFSRLFSSKERTKPKYKKPAESIVPISPTEASQTSPTENTSATAEVALMAQLMRVITSVIYAHRPCRIASGESDSSQMTHERRTSPLTWADDSPWDEEFLTLENQLRFDEHRTLVGDDSAPTVNELEFEGFGDDHDTKSGAGHTVVSRIPVVENVSRRSVLLGGDDSDCSIS